jgi:hypothetical protein
MAVFFPSKLGHEYSAAIWMRTRIASLNFVPEAFSPIFSSSVAMPRIAQLFIPAWQPNGGARRRRQGWPSR